MEDTALTYSKREYPQLDVMKCCMAVLVVAIHTVPLPILPDSFLSQLYERILRLAVPFFFMTTGFLLAKKQQASGGASDSSVLLEGCRKTLRLYLIWSVIYLPAAIAGYMNEGTGLAAGAVKYMLSLVLVGEHFYSWPLWYLLAACYGLLGMAVLRRFLGSKGVCIAGLMLFFIAHVVNGIYQGTPVTDLPAVLLGHLTKPLIVGGPGRILIGMFYLSVGWLLGEHECHFPRYLLCVLVPALLVLSACLDWWPAALLCQVCFFLWALGLKITLPVGIAHVLRRSSSVIYFTHMLFHFVWYLLHGGTEAPGPAAFAWAMAWSILACALVITLERRKPNAQLTKYLF